MAGRRPSVLLGRAGERELLDRLLGNVRGGQSAVLVVRGEAGVGKTALLRDCAARASAFRVANVAGVESEMELPYAGLHQLCAPMLDRAGSLPEPQRAALQVALGVSSGAAPDRFLVALATLSLLAEVAAPEDNVIADNDVFWNNFNYFRGAPFEVRRGAKGLSYPVGSGILLYGSQRTRIENNRVFGHFLVGVGLVDAIELSSADKAAIRDSSVTNNAFGRDGTDLNNVDLFYAGTIRGENRNNCFSGNSGVQKTVPADGSTMKPCSYSGPNPANGDAFTTAIRWISDPTHEANWVVRDHPPFEGITPLVHYTGKKK